MIARALGPAFVAAGPYPERDRLETDGGASRPGATRRALRLLDGLLWELEELNEAGREALPETLEASLCRLGIPEPGARSVTALHEAVLDLQRPLLGHPARGGDEYLDWREPLPRLTALTRCSRP